MARRHQQPLTVAFIESIRGKPKAQRYFDRLGQNLHLYVGSVSDDASEKFKRNPPKSWVVRCNVEGIRFERGLGGYPELGLKQARQRAQSIQMQLLEGKNSFQEQALAKARRKELEAAARKEAERRRFPFAEAVYRYYALNESSWTPEHAKIWIAMFRNHTFDEIGDRPIEELAANDISKLLAPIILAKPDTGKRLRQRIEAIFDWAIAAGYYSKSNPARYRSKLKHLLPKTNHRPKHRKALPWKEVPAFWNDLKKEDCTSARALKFLILTCTRSGEARGTSWEEIDTDEATWTIPAERMKARDAHRVPLSTSAMELLTTCKGVHAQIVFPSDRVRRDGSEYLGENALTSFLKKSMSRSDFTPHGFRSSFRDWASEYAQIPREVSEKVLAHKVGDAVERAYARSDLLDLRRDAMQRWADFLEFGTARSPDAPN